MESNTTVLSQKVLEKVGIQTFIGNLNVLISALEATLATMMSTFPNNGINKSKLSW